MADRDENMVLGRLKELAHKIAEATAQDPERVAKFGGHCLAEEVDELSALFRVQLPPDYREFLLLCRRVFAPDIRSGYFLFSPISILDTWAQSGTPRRIQVDTPEYAGELPTIPIGGDALGNLFLLSVSEDLNGSVWKWDHGVPPRHDGILTHGVTRRASSFSDFVERFAEDWLHHLEDDAEWLYL